MICVAILEDSIHDQQVLRGYLEQFSKGTEKKFDLHFFSSGIDFLESGTSQYDIVFMDIQMPLMNGMEVARKMRVENSHSILVFVTNAAQFALQGYEVDAMDYLLKPVGYFNFSLKLRKAIACLSERQTNVKKIAVNTSDGIHLLVMDSIRFVEVNQHILTYHAENDISIRGTLKKAEEELSIYCFARCNNAQLVNLRYVECVQNDVVQLHDGSKLPLSRREKKEFLAQLMDYLAGRG